MDRERMKIFRGQAFPVIPALALLVMLAAAGSPARGQRVTIIGEEPSREELGAPVYPGATFVRTLSSLDPFYESVIYVSPDPVGDVKNWLADQLPKARMVQYRDEGEWVWAYLLGNWIPFPEEPTRDDLPILDVSPNVLTRKYQRELFEPLVELLSTRPGHEKQLEALAEAKTIIRYTYRMIEEDIAFTKIQGVWMNTNRELPAFSGCIYEFRADSTYTLTYTDRNIPHLAAFLMKRPAFFGRDASEVEAFIRSRNPEHGTYAVMRNAIDMFVESEPIFDEVMSGLLEVDDLIMSMQLINMPKLTYIRTKRE